HDALYIGDVHAVARRSIAVNADVDVASAGQAFRERRGDAGNRLDDALDFGGDAVDLLQTRSCNFYADRALDAGCQHVDPVADGRHPDVGEPRHLHYAVEFLHQLVRCHARAPFAPRLELYRGLEHFERRWVGRRVGAPGLAEDAR